MFSIPYMQKYRIIFNNKVILNHKAKARASVYLERYKYLSTDVFNFAGNMLRNLKAKNI